VTNECSAFVCVGEDNASFSHTGRTSAKRSGAFHAAPCHRLGMDEGGLAAQPARMVLMATHGPPLGRPWSRRRLSACDGQLGLRPRQRANICRRLEAATCLRRPPGIKSEGQIRRPAACCIAPKRSRSCGRPLFPIAMSSTLSDTTSQPRSLLSMARLNRQSSGSDLRLGALSEWTASEEVAASLRQSFLCSREPV
jgi:hypothetical protein